MRSPVAVIDIGSNSIKVLVAARDATGRLQGLKSKTIDARISAGISRERPMLGDDKPICIPRAKWMDTNASYPSGHATTGWVWGLILAEVQPARASALAAAAKEAAYSRVVCGVHYQSDIDAGEKLGAAMVARLHADPAFRADLAKARLELARAPAPGGCGVY